MTSKARPSLKNRTLSPQYSLGKHPSTNAAFAYPDQEKGVEKPLFPSAE